MEKLFLSGKIKTTFLIFILLLIIFFGIFTITIFVKQISVKVTLICFILGAAYPLIKKVYLEYKTKIIFTEKKIESYRYNVKINLSWDDIIKIEYKGIKYFPIFELIIVHDKYNQKALVDFNFHKYLFIWKEITNICNEKKLKVEIDERLKNV